MFGWGVRERQMSQAHLYHLDVILWRQWWRYSDEIIIYVMLVVMGWTSCFVGQHEEEIEARLSITITVVLTLVQSTTARPSVIADVPFSTLFDQFILSCVLLSVIAGIENVLVVLVCRTNNQSQITQAQEAGLAAPAEPYSFWICNNAMEWALDTKNVDFICFCAMLCFWVFYFMYLFIKISLERFQRLEHIYFSMDAEMGRPNDHPIYKKREELGGGANLQELMNQARLEDQDVIIYEKNKHNGVWRTAKCFLDIPKGNQPFPYTMWPIIKMHFERKSILEVEKAVKEQIAVNKMHFGDAVAARQMKDSSMPEIVPGPRVFYMDAGTGAFSIFCYEWEYDANIPTARMLEFEGKDGVVNDSAKWADFFECEMPPDRRGSPFVHMMRVFMDEQPNLSEANWRAKIDTAAEKLASKLRAWDLIKDNYKMSSLKKTPQKLMVGLTGDNRDRLLKENNSWVWAVKFFATVTRKLKLENEEGQSIAEEHEHLGKLAINVELAPFFVKEEIEAKWDFQSVQWLFQRSNVNVRSALTWPDEDLTGQPIRIEDREQEELLLFTNWFCSELKARAFMELTPIQLADMSKTQFLKSFRDLPLHEDKNEVSHLLELAWAMMYKDHKGKKGFEDLASRMMNDGPLVMAILEHHFFVGVIGAGMGHTHVTFLDPNKVNAHAQKVHSDHIISSMVKMGCGTAIREDGPCYAFDTTIDIKEMKRVDYNPLDPKGDGQALLKWQAFCHEQIENTMNSNQSGLFICLGSMNYAAKEVGLKDKLVAANTFRSKMRQRLAELGQNNTVQKIVIYMLQTQNQDLTWEDAQDECEELMGSEEGRKTQEKFLREFCNNYANLGKKSVCFNYVLFKFRLNVLLVFSLK